MQLDTVLFERRDRIAYVTLQRPDKLNALNGFMIKELHAAADAIAADIEVRAVLLTGAGRAFCSGADLHGNDLIENSALSPGENIRVRLQQQFNPMVQAWYRLPVPVVVAVNGIAAGAGVSLALTGDVVLAARSASFLQLFAPKLGLMPDLGSTFYLPRLVGAARAKGLALLGDTLSAADAADWGLIWGCTDDTALPEQAETLVRRLANGPTAAYRRIKEVFNDSTPRTFAEQLAIEADHQAKLGDTRDFAEGLDAFRHKRTPKFSGE